MIYGEADASIVLVQMVDSHDLEGIESEVDGSTEIHRDDRELGYAEWVERKDIILHPTDHSLTNEMMRKFRDGYPEKDP